MRTTARAVFYTGCILVLLHTWVAFITGMDSIGQIWGIQ